MVVYPDFGSRSTIYSLIPGFANGTACVDDFGLHALRDDDERRVEVESDISECSLL